MNEAAPAMGDEDPSPSRKDFQPTNAAPKTRKKRVAKPRYDTPPADFAVDGWGDPFDVVCAPGWVAFWASDFDRNRMARRRWEPGCWGDRRIVSYDGAVAGKKGVHIKHRELSLMIMAVEDADRAKANDPRLRGRAELQDVLWTRARTIGDGRGRTGRVDQITQTRGLNHARD